MIAELKSQLDEIQRCDVVREQLLSSGSEDAFNEIAVKLLIEVGQYACVAASILPGHTKSWHRDQAIIGGNVVRLFKLVSAMLDQTCQHRRETTFIFARLAFETIVNIRYLIEFASPELFESYIRYSLRHERRLHDDILKNIEARRGEELPIEKRMLNSIRRTARRSGVEIEDASPSRPKNWGDTNLFQRAQAVGLQQVYSAAFGGGSHSVHGNWMDLLDYHLEDNGEGFRPRLRWRHPRPQVLLMVALLSVEVIDQYLLHISNQYVGDSTVHHLVEGKLSDLGERVRLADQIHEEFLTADK